MQTRDDDSAEQIELAVDLDSENLVRGWHCRNRLSAINATQCSAPRLRKSCGALIILVLHDPNGLHETGFPGAPRAFTKQR